jgi:hypothetical protein
VVLQFHKNKGYFANVVNRNLKEEIASQLLEKNINLLLGGGRRL